MGRNEERIALFDQAVELIEGVPAEALDLKGWGHENNAACGTIACAAGWLTYYKFGGLVAEMFDWTPTFKSGGDYFCGYSALAKVLDIYPSDVVDLFYPRSGIDRAKGLYGSDKQVWLARAEKYRSQMVAGTLPFYDGEME